MSANTSSQSRRQTSPQATRGNSRKTGTTSKRSSGSVSTNKLSLTGGVRNLAIAIFVGLVGVVSYLILTAGQSVTSSETSGDQFVYTAEQLLEVKNPKGLKEELIPYTAMNVSFNRSTHQPNWVAWELLANEVSGESAREPSFHVDENVYGSATPDDYRHTGFDRGHMAPAGDMKWHKQAMRESFYMTNISPQSPDLNRGAWKKLEEKCRQRALVDSSLIIICGPIFDKSGPSARIGASSVAVPNSFFKVILAPFVEHPWAIGFIMPNEYVAGGMQKAAVPVDEVEAVTGYDFFSALPDSLEAIVESHCDFQAFSRLPRRK